MKLEQKLVKIFECIDSTCSSSVRLFNSNKHTSRSVGTTAYEERQAALLLLADEYPEVIERLCKKGGHWYFKFNGRTIKIISSNREPLAPNVFAKNAFESDQRCLPTDALLRIIYKADYDLDEHEAVIRECFYIEVDRETGDVLREIDILTLANGGGFVEEVIEDEPKEVELAIPGLISQTNQETEENNE